MIKKIAIALFILFTAAITNHVVKSAFSDYIAFDGRVFVQADYCEVSGNTLFYSVNDFRDKIQVACGDTRCVCGQSLNWSKYDKK